MCGIAGIYTRHNAVAEKALSRQIRALSHRGPDDEGLWHSGGIGLIHTRLSIIDLAGGHQPLQDDAGDLTMVANGEIYNFIELREQLSRDGQPFTTQSDSEVILRGYAQYGSRILAQLQGMFAFALYDARKQRLLLARDRLGIKPLFYYQDDKQFVFASEIKGILAVLDHTPQPHPDALNQYLQNQFNSGRDTIFRGIKRVLPGELISIDANLALTHQRYWSPLQVMPREIDFDTAQQVFNQLFDNVMEQHMRADVPFGLFLSGGVDSAILAAALSRLRDEPLRTFSVGFANVEMRDELSDAERIAKLFATQHTELRLDQTQILHRLPHSVWASDELMRDFASLPTSLLSQHAAQELKVVFSGEGGDEAFGGYGRYRPGRLEAGLKNLLCPGSGGFRCRGHWRQPWPKRVFGSRLRQAQRAFRAPIIDAWQQTPAQWSNMQRRQYVDLVTALPDNLLVKADRMMMAFGLEGRVPFVDHRIVEFGLSLPDELKIRSGQGKLFLKQWAEQYLPKEHLWMKKRGFHVPVGEWLRGDFLNQLGKKLASNAAINTWFQRHGVEQLIDAQHKHPRYSREIWSLMQFAIWHRLFIENPGSQPGPDENPLAWIGS